MKDLVSIWYFLGITVAYSPHSQSKFVAEDFERARLVDNKILDTPIEVNARNFFFDDLLLLDLILYYIIVKSLVFLIITCLDIVYVVHLIS